MIDMLRYLLPYIARYRWKYLLGGVFLLGANIFRVINPKVVQHAVDYLKSRFSLDQLAVYSGLIVLVAIGEGVFTFLMRRSLIVASREIENDLRNDFFARLVTLSPGFFQRMPTGDIMSRATNDLSAVRSVLGPGIAYSFNTLLALCFILPMMLMISPRLTLFAMLPFPVLAFLVNRFGRAIYRRFERIQAQFSVLSTRAQENISGSTIIRWFAREPYEIELFRKENRRYMELNIDYARLQAAYRPLLWMIIGLSIAIIILVGGRLVIDRVITLGEFTAFMLYMNALIWPTVALGWVIGLMQQGAASLRRMREIYEATPEVADAPEVIIPSRFRGDIRFVDFTFGYRPDRPVLQNIDLHIPAHQTLGVIGPTGCGKSTLVKQIPHFFPLPEGVLFIDGQDINRLPLKYLRRHIGYVPQETFLFSDTIRNNIAYARPEATQEEIEQAAKMAEIHHQILEFPDGYDSMLGEKGINLSGGQKQRVAIARAILRDPRILILDDAFSALDTQTEEKILGNLQTFFPDRTVILVSHRVSTLQNCDRIVVLEDGRITEQGAHQELIRKGGLYAWIHEKQLLEEELESVD